MMKHKVTLANILEGNPGHVLASALEDGETKQLRLHIKEDCYISYSVEHSKNGKPDKPFNYTTLRRAIHAYNAL